jgi:hypothetical protein
MDRLAHSSQLMSFLMARMTTAPDRRSVKVAFAALVIARLVAAVGIDTSGVTEIDSYVVAAETIQRI